MKNENRSPVSFEATEVICGRSMYHEKKVEKSGVVSHPNVTLSWAGTTFIVESHLSTGRKFARKISKNGLHQRVNYALLDFPYAKKHYNRAVAKIEKL